MLERSELCYLASLEVFLFVGLRSGEARCVSSLIEDLSLVTT